jgi:hypothetical protein
VAILDSTAGIKNYALAENAAAAKEDKPARPLLGESLIGRPLDTVSQQRVPGRPSTTGKNCTRRRNEYLAKGAINTGE